MNPLLKIQDLKKAYASPDGVSSLVVDVPAFSIDAGQQVALEGSSGSGKTTFLNLIAGILKADSGVIEIDGESMTAGVEALRDQIRARKIGYIFQTFNLLQGYTALENVLLGMLFGMGPNTHLAESLLRRVGLAERMKYRPRQLSVGQQQRVAVARALANKPRLILADEPTGNLDRRHGLEALKLIRETCAEQGAALLIVSHDPDVLRQFDVVYKLSEINRAATQIDAEILAGGSVA